MPYQVMAASTSDALEPIMPEKECSLTVSYCCGETAFSGVEVKLYRIAEVSADFKYTLTQPFETSGLMLDGIQTVGEWNLIRSTLETHILAYNISSEFTAETNDDGQVSFEALKTGMYLAIVSKVEWQDLYYQFDSALIALPGLESDDRWQYQVSVNAKGEVLPSVDPDEEIELKVLKLWKGDETPNNRPESIEVEIFCNETSYKTVILSEDNHWAYTWSAKNDGSNWTVIERNVPQGYTMTVEERRSSFVLTNTWSPTYPDDPDEPPQMGDTTNILLYALLMIGSGSMLIILSIAGKKTRL
jgi:hypothetical protein